MFIIHHRVFSVVFSSTWNDSRLQFACQDREVQLIATATLIVVYKTYDHDESSLVIVSAPQFSEYKLSQCNGLWYNIRLNQMKLSWIQIMPFIDGVWMFYFSRN